MGQALRSLVFRPPIPATYVNNSNFRWLPTRGGSVIPAVYLQRNSSLIVLYSHGNAEDLGLVLPYALRCADKWGVSFFCYEYTGYGLSSGGCPSEDHLYSDVEAAYHYIIETLQYSPSNIVLFGKSLGSIPATHMASLKCDIAALVLQSGLASIFRVKLPHIPGKYPGDIGCNIDKIGRVKCPALIIHGSDDTLCTLSHAKALASKHAGVTVTCFIEGAGHNDLDWPPFLAHVDVAVTAFLRRISKLVETQHPHARCVLKASAAADIAAFAYAIKGSRAAHQAECMNRRHQKHFSSSSTRQTVSALPATAYNTVSSDFLVGRTGLTGTTRSLFHCCGDVDDNWSQRCRKTLQQARMLRVLQRLQLLQQQRQRVAAKVGISRVAESRGSYYATGVRRARETSAVAVPSHASAVGVDRYFFDDTSYGSSALAPAQSSTKINVSASTLSC